MSKPIELEEYKGDLLIKHNTSNGLLIAIKNVKRVVKTLKTAKKLVDEHNKEKNLT